MDADQTKKGENDASSTDKDSTSNPSPQTNDQGLSTPQINPSDPSEPEEKQDESQNESIQQPQLHKMDVHHHGHMYHEKKWKEYLFQFFMLFLAVFCGFLAEYQLEHVIENNREKQFMKTMMEDLEIDVRNIQQEIMLAKVQQAALDSLTTIIYGESLHQPQINKLYELQRKYIYFRSLRMVNRTELQLKNAGGMRLIRNSAVADSIIHYWSIADQLYTTMENIDNHRIKSKDLSFLIFNNKYYTYLNEATSMADVQLDYHSQKLTLMDNNPAILLEFANRLSHMKDLMKFIYIPRLNRQALYAGNLIGQIKKEFNF